MARDPKVWVLARTSAKWHRIGASRTPRHPAEHPGVEVLCGWKVQHDPASGDCDLTPVECVTCNREAERVRLLALPPSARGGRFPGAACPHGLSGGVACSSCKEIV